MGFTSAICGNGWRNGMEIGNGRGAYGVFAMFLILFSFISKSSQE